MAQGTQGTQTGALGEWRLGAADAARGRRTGDGWLWRFERRLVARTWHRWSLDLVERRCRTPTRVYDFMHGTFDYVHDHVLHGVEEYWQPVEQTHELRRGDCEDWALYACHVLRRAGLAARVFAAFDAHEGHATCLVPWRDRWLRLGTRGLVELDVAVDASEVGVAHAAAESFYPGRWECCSFVERFGEGPASHRGTRALLPHYEWIEPARAEPRPDRADRG